MIKFEHYARYDIAEKNGSTLAYGTIKQESLDFAQAEANKQKRRVLVWDTHRNAKHYWEMIPSSEGAQGMRTHELKK